MDSKARPPKAGPLLYLNLFEHRERRASLEKIAGGISAIVDNAARLLSDVDLLVSQDRFSSARFLLTTAREEIGKALILLDMCRLDSHRYENVVRRLADAFYVHEAKQAYFSILEFSAFASMEHVRQFWEAEIVRWWPHDNPESGEPDMRHATYFDRELPLYVDFSGYDGDWTAPSNRYDSLAFEGILRSNKATRTRSVVDRFQEARNLELLSVESLAELNDVFSGLYFTEASSNADLDGAYARVSERVCRRLSLGPKQFRDSVLVVWPLYHFAQHRF
jgi:AbiV family abortive infection protein